jgi:hypothetical protein
MSGNMSMANLANMLKTVTGGPGSAPGLAKTGGRRRRRRSGTRKHRRGRGKKSRKNKWFF